MYYALSRGKVLNERVLDVRFPYPPYISPEFSHPFTQPQILLSSGAQLSRYLIQIAIHHYFHTQSHFIKTQWVRNVPLRVFIYFLKIAEERYGEIPRGRVSSHGVVSFMLFL